MPCNHFIHRFLLLPPSVFPSIRVISNESVLHIRWPKNVQTTTQLYSSHTLKSNAQNSPSQAQQYVNRELPDVQVGFRKHRGTRDQIANICWITEKAREFQKNIYFCFIDYVKAFDCVDHNKLWNILQEVRIPDRLTCLLRNLYAGQEATARTGHGTTDWFQIGREYVKAAYLTSMQSTL